MTAPFRFLLHKLIFALLFWVSATGCLATHIVGGEIELQYLGAGRTYSHRINLNLYFDQISGDPGAEDPSVVLGIFRKRDNAFLTGVELLRTGRQTISPTSPNCVLTNKLTRLIRYGLDLTLNAQAFNDPGGYYISWERCCRNTSISNIVSPEGAAAAFYFEFPALMNAGQRVSNSSPVFTIPTGDYICLNRSFNFDFSARDPDGDSLVYRLVTPYNGYSSSSPAANRNPAFGLDPVFYPGPYPAVRWQASFSENNAIPGPQPLQVNPRTGILTVTTNREGLYVFSVEVVEYRKGMAIGRVRRDYQLKAIDCPVNNPPVLLMKAAGERDFYKPGTLLNLKDTDKACFTLFITDPNANQFITVANGSGTLTGLTITPGVIATKNGRDTTTTQFCFDACSLYNNGKGVSIVINATDDGCPQGLTTQLTIPVLVTGSPALRPAASTDLGAMRATVAVGTSLTFSAFGKDLQSGPVAIRAVGRGFDFAASGMTFAPRSGTATVAAPFTWKPTCGQINRPEYVVDFIATSTRCNVERRDTTTVRLVPLVPENQPPTIRTSLPGRVVDLLVLPTDTAGGGVRFTVFANDLDKTDTLRLTGAGRGFDLAGAGMQFLPKTGRPELQSEFRWQATCATLQGKSEATYVLDFTDTDRGCRANNFDTTSVVLRLRTPVVDYETLKIPNVITPNGDGKNDYFGLMNVPVENCTERFERVQVFNRWGKSVYESRDRNFRWFAPNYPAGTYFYGVVFGNQTFKGTLSILR